MDTGLGFRSYIIGYHPTVSQHFDRCDLFRDCKAKLNQGFGQDTSSLSWPVERMQSECLQYFWRGPSAGKGAGFTQRTTGFRIQFVCSLKTKEFEESRIVKGKQHKADSATVRSWSNLTSTLTSPLYSNPVKLVPVNPGLTKLPPPGAQFNNFVIES